MLRRHLRRLSARQGARRRGRSSTTTEPHPVCSHGELIAFHRWTSAGRAVEDRDGAPFYGLVELQPGPSSDEFFFRYDYVPLKDGPVTMVDAAFVQAMRNGWLVVIDEVNTARDVALLSINATLDGRLALYLPATGETVVAKPGFGVLLSYNPGLVGTDIPDAWRSRFPATLEVTSNWPVTVASQVRRLTVPSKVPLPTASAKRPVPRRTAMVPVKRALMLADWA